MPSISDNTWVLIVITFFVIIFTMFMIEKNKPIYPSPREYANLQSYNFGFPTNGYYNYGSGPLKGVPKMWYNYGYGYPSE